MSERIVYDGSLKWRARIEKDHHRRRPFVCILDRHFIRWEPARRRRFKTEGAAIMWGYARLDAIDRRQPWHGRVLEDREVP